MRDRLPWWEWLPWGLCGLLLAYLAFFLWYRSRTFCTKRPSFGTWPWPHLFVVISAGVLLSAGAHLFSGEGVFRNVPGQVAEAAKQPLKRAVDSLFPWHPIPGWLLVWLPWAALFLFGMYWAARLLGRRSFHWLSVLALFLGVALIALKPEGLQGRGAPEERGDAEIQAAARNSAPEPPARPGKDIVLGRVGDRVVRPIMGGVPVIADAAILAALAVLVLIIFRRLDSINLAQALLNIQVVGIRDERQRRRVDLERLMRECLHQNAPHSPPRTPGGVPVYWQDFIEKQREMKDSRWTSRVISLLMALVVPNRGARLKATLITQGETAKGQDPAKEQGQKPAQEQGQTSSALLRVEMSEAHTDQTLMSLPFRGPSADDATQAAAYAAAERVLVMCPHLPEWVYWREQNGEALMKYWKGVEKVRHAVRCDEVVKGLKELKSHDELYSTFERLMPREALKGAQECFEQAATRSPSNALARLQLAEIYEIKEADHLSAIEIYQELGTRYPHLMLARYRLSAALSSVGAWGPAERAHASPPHTSPRTRLRVAFSRQGAERSAAYKRIQELVTRLRGALTFSRKRKAANARRRAAFENIQKLEDLEDAAFQQCMLELSGYYLEDLGLSLRWRLLGWCLRSTADRRYFWGTLGWRPGRWRGNYTALMVAREAVCLRQARLSWSRMGDSQVTANVEVKAKVEVEANPQVTANVQVEEGVQVEERAEVKEIAQKVKDCIQRVKGIEKVANRAVRKRGEFWGLAHYNLACFYALCLSPWQGTSELHKHVDALKDEDLLVHKIVEHLSHCLRDPKGPLSSPSSLLWLLYDTDLKLLWKRPGFDEFKAWIRTVFLVHSTAHVRAEAPA